jgi:hypothetical protein
MPGQLLQTLIWRILNRYRPDLLSKVRIDARAFLCKAVQTETGRLSASKTTLSETVLEKHKRSDTMGDKGGKKDKEKGQKQSADKQKQKSKDKFDRQPKRKP